MLLGETFVQILLPRLFHLVLKKELPPGFPVSVAKDGKVEAQLGVGRAGGLLWKLWMGRIGGSSLGRAPFPCPTPLLLGTTPCCPY